MAYITKVKAGWRAQIERKGVRDSITLPTKSAVSQWATKREAVDLRAGVVTLAAHKTVAQVGRRLVPLTPAGLRLLRVLVEGGTDGERLISLSPASLDTLFRRITRQVLVPDAHFHDARATALTMMSRRMDVLTLARISGHKDLSLLLSTYYRESAAEVSARLARPSASHR